MATTHDLTFAMKFSMTTDAEYWPSGLSDKVISFNSTDTAYLRVSKVDDAHFYVKFVDEVSGFQLSLQTGTPIAYRTYTVRLYLNATTGAADLSVYVHDTQTTLDTDIATGSYVGFVANNIYLFNEFTYPYILKNMIIRHGNWPLSQLVEII